MRARLAVTVALLALLAACESPGGGPAEPTLIGTVAAVAGSPTVVRRSQVYIVDLQSRIYEGDIVQTDRTSKARIEMIDSSVIAVAPASHLLFHEYAFDAADQSLTASMTLTAGAIRTTGRFSGASRRPSFEVRTPLAVIGAMSGSFWGGFLFGDNTLDVIVLDGAGLIVENDHGSVALTEHRTGTTVVGGTGPQAARAWPEARVRQAEEATRVDP